MSIILHYILQIDVKRGIILHSYIVLRFDKFLFFIMRIRSHSCTAHFIVFYWTAFLFSCYGFWKRGTLLEKNAFGKGECFWKRGMLLEKGNAFGKEECFWKRGKLLEKGNAFGKEECFWKRGMLLEKGNAFGKGPAEMAYQFM